MGLINQSNPTEVRTRPPFRRADSHQLHFWCFELEVHSSGLLFKQLHRLKSAGLRPPKCFKVPLRCDEKQQHQSEAILIAFNLIDQIP